MSHTNPNWQGGAAGPKNPPSSPPYPDNPHRPHSSPRLEPPNSSTIRGTLPPHQQKPDGIYNQPTIQRPALKTSQLSTQPEPTLGDKYHAASVTTPITSLPTTTTPPYGRPYLDTSPHPSHHPGSSTTPRNQFSPHRPPRATLPQHFLPTQPPHQTTTTIPPHTPPAPNHTHGAKHSTPPTPPTNAPQNNSVPPPTTHHHTRPRRKYPPLVKLVPAATYPTPQHNLTPATIPRYGHASGHTEVAHNYLTFSRRLAPKPHDTITQIYHTGLLRQRYHPTPEPFPPTAPGRGYEHFTNYPTSNNPSGDPQPTGSPAHHSPPVHHKLLHRNYPQAARPAQHKHSPIQRPHRQYHTPHHSLKPPSHGIPLHPKHNPTHAKLTKHNTILRSPSSPNTITTTPPPQSHLQHPANEHTPHSIKTSPCHKNHPTPHRHSPTPQSPPSPTNLLTRGQYHPLTVRGHNPHPLPRRDLSTIPHPHLITTPPQPSNAARAPTTPPPPPIHPPPSARPTHCEPSNTYPP